MKTLALIMAFAACVTAAGAADHGKTVYVQFIRGTDRDCASCRQVGPKLSNKLSPVFRWKHFWEVGRKKLVVNAKKTTTIELPGDRKLELQLAGAGAVDARLYRRTGLVTKAHERFKSRMIILGGEEDNRESFFVVIREDEPGAGE